MWQSVADSGASEWFARHAKQEEEGRAVGRGRRDGSHEAVNGGTHAPETAALHLCSVLVWPARPKWGRRRGLPGLVGGQARRRLGSTEATTRLRPSRFGPFRARPC